MRQVNFIIACTTDIGVTFAKKQPHWSRVDKQIFLDHHGILTHVLDRARDMRGCKGGVAYLCPLWYERVDYREIRVMIDDRDYQIRYL